ncbi:MAG: transcriptional regulator [Oscillatoria sp. SIO1A7]|nr:transcriptional regulator [Oscillatoria sp. SIO1A7]
MIQKIESHYAPSQYAPREPTPKGLKGLPEGVKGLPKEQLAQGEKLAMGLSKKVEGKIYELLSSYIDGEATAAERRQVNQLLDSDPDVKCLYMQLRQLGQKLQGTPVPQGQEDSVAKTVKRFFWILDCRRRRGAMALAGSAIAAAFVAAIPGMIPSQSVSSQMAQVIEKSPASEELTIALNKPIVVIPKAAIAAPVGQEIQLDRSIDSGKADR